MTITAQTPWRHLGAVPFAVWQRRITDAGGTAAVARFPVWLALGDDSALALAKVLGTPAADKIRTGPFRGGPPAWQYQNYLDLGGLKSSNFDFVVWQTNPYTSPVAIRVQTEFFHSFTTNAKHQYDVLHRLRAEENFDVVDIWDYLYLGDESGQAAILAVKDVPTATWEEPRHGSISSCV